MKEKLINSPEFKKYNQLKHSIDKEINGRICLTEYVQMLPTIKDILLKDECKNYCEIGVLHGGTMSLILNTEQPCNCYGIDIFSYYGKEIDPISKVTVSLENTKNNINKYNVDGKFNVELINGDSHNVETLNKLVKSLNGEQLDLLFIDGDHSYNGVIKDIEMYVPLVRKDGIIVFDNYDCKAWPQVKPAVDDFLSKNKDNFQILFKYVESYVVKKINK